MKIIQKHKGFRVFIFVYTLGKEEILINLSKHFKTLVCLSANSADRGERGALQDDSTSRHEP